MSLKIAVAQLNPIVGDLYGNWNKVKQEYLKASQEGADIFVTSECVIQGYPFEDLAYNRAFNQMGMDLITEITDFVIQCPKEYPALVVGVSRTKNNQLYNSVMFFEPGVGLLYSQDKVELPNYGVFDEKRIFTPGNLDNVAPFSWRGIKLGLMICEDMWWPNVASRLTSSDLIIVLNGSPFEVGKNIVRIQNAMDRALQVQAPLLYVNQVGGQDELVFDGGSFFAGRKGVVQFPFFEEGVFYVEHTIYDIELSRYAEGTKNIKPTGTAEIYMAGVLALRDYIAKQKRNDGSPLFTDVCLGLSGGIDSGVVAAQAVDALGAEHVHAIRLPSEVSSDHSLADAEEEAKLLGINMLTVDIRDVVGALELTLDPYFSNMPKDTTEENLQARTRGTLLMAFSNKFGWMLLSTGNKTENAVGYSTIYGDMNGGYNTLKDVYKMDVYSIAKWRNAQTAETLPKWFKGPSRKVIPQNTIDKEPSAELKYGQKDSDSLPPYPVLDDILEKIVDRDLTISEVVQSGHDRAIVERITRMLFNAEYKRRQACPGAKITHKIFGRDRRWPIVNAWKEKE
jgi:NAD+ synthase